MRATLIGIIDYGVCNVGSVRNMLRRSAILAEILEDPRDIRRVEKIILPGVGHFGTGMEKLKSTGFANAIRDAVLADRKPLLGICLGLQLLGKGSEEGGTEGLNLLDAECIAFRKNKFTESLRIPHMGWNTPIANKGSELTNNIDQESRFYFVHSYHMKVSKDTDVLFWCDYGYRFAAGISVRNIHGVQFHPEKSHHFGRILLENFARRV